MSPAHASQGSFRTSGFIFMHVTYPTSVICGHYTLEWWVGTEGSITTGRGALGLSQPPKPLGGGRAAQGHHRVPLGEQENSVSGLWGPKPMGPSMVFPEGGTVREIGQKLPSFSSLCQSPEEGQRSHRG